MCSNFQSIKPEHAAWVQEHFQCELPHFDWREEIYPGYQTPFIWFENNQARCDLAQFGLVPAWAAEKSRFSARTYNARSETVAEKPSYRHAWKQRNFGLAIMQSFYEPNYHSGKAVRWRIKRADTLPIAVASIWERFVNHVTGEILFSFSMLTVNASKHKVMQQFHKPEDEKRSIVLLHETEYWPWLQANRETVRNFLRLTPDNFLMSGPAPH